MGQADQAERGRWEAPRAGIVRIQQEIAALDLDLDSVMTVMSERARSLAGATAGLIELVEGEEIVCRASSGDAARQLGARLRLDASLSGVAVREARVVRSNDLLQEQRADRDFARAVNARSVIIAPLRAGSEVIGVLKVMASRTDAFSAEDETHMQILVESLGAVIQRHRIAQQLRASEEQYRLLFDRHPQPMWVYETRQLRFLAVNQAAIAHYGYSEQEFLAMTVHPVWADLDACAVERAFLAEDGAGRPSVLSGRHRRKDGSVFDVELSADSIRFDGQPARLVQAQDVTQRLRAERELARAARAQAMLSACNEALVRAEAESALLAEICRIAVEIGNYRVGHVAFPLNDDSKELKVVAHAGASSGYVLGIRASWDAARPEGRMPSARAFRSGRPVIVEDLRADAEFAPWLAQATAYGFRGLVALPLCDHGQSFGVLALITSEETWFPEHEVRLLETLANNLAFGIANLRARDNQKRVQSAIMKIAASVSAGSGREFHEQLARNAAEALGAFGAFVARRVPGSEPPSARTLAFVLDGQLRDNFDFAWPPADEPLDAALAGLPPHVLLARRLDNAQGQPLGVLAALFAEPLQPSEFAASTLQIFAARAAAEMERQDADARIRDQASLLDKAQDAIVVRGIDHSVQFWNKSAEQLYGWTAAEMLGRSVETRMAPRELAAYRAAHQLVMARGEWSGEILQSQRDGREITVEVHWTLVRDDFGQPQSVLAINTDITQRKANEREIEKLAFYDSLTGLPNRALLTDRLQHALSACSRSRRGGALLFIDLDNFKTLNDTLGHDMGDLLLQQVASRLRECVRHIDTVARLGGDEFVVMLEELSEQPQEAAVQARAVGEKILAALTMPYLLMGYTHQSSSSIGLAPFGARHGGVGELLKQADLAMYQAKAAGRNTMRFFDPEMQAAVSERAALEADLRLALERSEFLLHYQPQVDGRGRVTGAEALVRWQHPARGLVSPALFIPLAEETGLIMPLGRWVLESACGLLAAWQHEAATAALTVAVNVSSRQFRHPDFVAQVVSVLQTSGINPMNLKLELTESLLVDDMELIIQKMGTLKALGVGFSLDDFGTGYSSLSYLKQLPLDQLKIDQSFVRDVLTDPNDAAIARTIIALGQSLGLNVIAEGVETEAQREFLRAHGCLACQGYLFSRPLPLDALRAFLQARVPA